MTDYGLHWTPKYRQGCAYKRISDEQQKALSAVLNNPFETEGPDVPKVPKVAPLEPTSLKEKENSQPIMVYNGSSLDPTPAKEKENSQPIMNFTG